MLRVHVERLALSVDMWKIKTGLKRRALTKLALFIHVFFCLSPLFPSFMHGENELKRTSLCNYTGSYCSRHLLYRISFTLGSVTSVHHFFFRNNVKNYNFPKGRHDINITIIHNYVVWDDWYF